MSLDSNLQSAFTAVGNAVKSKINNSEKGAANGIATLDATGKIPSAQMPGSVDQILEYTNLAAFPATGALSYMYLDLSNGKVYRWSGTVYVEMSPSEVNSVNGMTGTVVIGNATTGASGLMSNTDKTKLDGIAAGAQVNVGTNISEGIRTSTSVPVVSSTGTSATLSVASTTLAGIMSAADKTKLDGIASGANNYTLPSGTSTVLGGVKLSSDTVQTVVANAITTTASRTYGLQVNASGQGVLNVPWIDTTYSNATTSVSGLMSSSDKTKLDDVGATNTDYVAVLNAAMM